MSYKIPVMITEFRSTTTRCFLAREPVNFPPDFSARETVRVCRGCRAKAVIRHRLIFIRWARSAPPADACVIISKGLARCQKRSRRCKTQHVATIDVRGVAGYWYRANRRAETRRSCLSPAGTRNTQIHKSTTRCHEEAFLLPVVIPPCGGNRE